MTDIQETSALLSKKLELFLQYEQASLGALQAQEDDIEDYITKRTDLANIIDEQTAKISKICDKKENFLLKTAVSCSADYDSLDKQLVPIYTIARDIFAVISRISDINSDIESMLKAKKEMYAQRLRETKNTPKIARYLNTLKGTEDTGNYIGDIST